METQEKQMMQGSEGKNDYLIIAVQGQVAIGIKPVIEPFVSKENGEAFLLGIRLRLASAPGQAILNAEHAAKTLFPMIPWQKFAADRVSVFLGAIVPPFPAGMKLEVLMGNLNKSGFFNQLQECITPIFEATENTPHTTEEIIDFVKEQYGVLFATYVPAEVANTFKGTVLPFKAKQ